MSEQKYECWMCKHWNSQYEVRERGEIQYTVGKCKHRHGTVRDDDLICWNFKRIPTKEEIENG